MLNCHRVYVDIQFKFDDYSNSQALVPLKFPQLVCWVQFGFVTIPAHNHLHPCNSTVSMLIFSLDLVNIPAHNHLHPWNIHSLYVDV